MNLEKPMAQKLIDMAIKARDMAYAPYSGFKVGAALLSKSDKIYMGCNIESASYTPSNCAERTAFFKAVSEGDKDFLAIAVVGAPEGENINRLCPPCGVCRQVMMEFCDPDNFEILQLDEDKNVKSFTLKELLPMGFGPKSLI
ncbi:MAG: Cytidine deaminase [Eubacteriales bacterium SKADARSKE-1]|nr:Cytidine deaminase [Eubacteriales bacterium SKADARSKE-1]